jgi:hypothetical protein
VTTPATSTEELKREALIPLMSKVVALCESDPPGTISEKGATLTETLDGAAASGVPAATETPTAPMRVAFWRNAEMVDPKVVDMAPPRTSTERSRVIAKGA